MSDQFFADVVTILGETDAARLLTALEEGLHVHRRYQFFMWTQGRMQGLIPHGMLICGVQCEGGGVLFDCFYNFPVPPETIARLCHSKNGIAVELLDQWIANGCEPFGLDDAAAAAARATAAQVRQLGLGDLIAHGIPATPASRGAHGFFGFASIPRAIGARERHFARLLTPHIFNAYSRVLAFDRPTVTLSRLSEQELSVTQREIEILGWIREGKSNQEIGIILSISPLTVKNHVQKILRKLQSTNRAQAVSKAMTLRLLGPGRISGDLADFESRTPH